MKNKLNNIDKLRLGWKAAGTACWIPIGVAGAVTYPGFSSEKTETSTVAPEAPPENGAENTENMMGTLALGFGLTVICAIAVTKLAQKHDQEHNFAFGFTVGLVTLMTGIAAGLAYGSSTLDSEEPSKQATQTEISAEEVIAHQPSQLQATAKTTYIYQPGP